MAPARRVTAYSGVWAVSAGERHPVAAVEGLVDVAERGPPWTANCRPAETAVCTAFWTVVALNGGGPGGAVVTACADFSASRCAPPPSKSEAPPMAAERLNRLRLETVAISAPCVRYWSPERPPAMAASGRSSSSSASSRLMGSRPVMSYTVPVTWAAYPSGPDRR
jgi:hypothetical protein